MNTNFLSKFLRFVSDVILSAESAMVDLLSATVVYTVPLVSAYLTYSHCITIVGLPPSVSFAAAFSVEVLGIAAVSTSVKFWKHNKRYADARNKAPFWLAVFSYVFYLVVTLAINVILEIVAGVRSPWIIVTIGLLSLLSVPSGVLISIRSLHTDMLEERDEVKRERAEARKQGGTFHA
jgi:hypothetical protein